MRLILMCLMLLLPLSATAQSPFDAAITVNGDAITNYELDQRTRMLRLFNTPGNLNTLAREQLIDDRLKLQEARRAGLVLADEALRTEIEAFAGRANLPYAQFLQVLNSNGIEEATLRDFVRSGVTWRELIRSRYRGQAQVSDRDVAQAQGASGTGTEIEVLLSEIIIPMPPQRRAQVTATADRISQMRSTGEFERAARRYSALPSKARGGRLGWLPITNYPAGLRPMIIGLAPGEVTAPIPIPNAIALFQMRDIREVKGSRPAPAAIDYLTYTLPQGADPAKIAARVDRCDDFYGIAKGQPEELLQRQSQAPADIPTDIASVLAGLDANELSWGLVNSAGQPMMVMLCLRTSAAAEGLDTDALRVNLLGQRLSGYADALLADLKASARIEG